MKQHTFHAVAALCLLVPVAGQDGKTPETPLRVQVTNVAPTLVSGVFPQSAVMAPGSEVYGEVALGGLVAWASRLWAVGSVADENDRGIGLYEVEPDLSVWLHRDSVAGTYTNRLVHWPSNQAFAGPYAIRVDGEVRTVHRMKDYKLAATATHLTHPDDKVYYLTMDGLLFEVDVRPLQAAQIADLRQVLKLPGKPRFTSAYTAQDELVVAAAGGDDGCLAEWDGRDWRIVERGSWLEVSGGKRRGAGAHGREALLALGWNSGSAVLRIREGGHWQRYLLPMAHEPGEDATARIRELQSGQYLMDAFGVFYELAKPKNDRWSVRPICTHLRRVTDFCQYRGLLVLAGGPTGSNVGQPQTAMWFGSVDDLWKLGKPTGRGGPWRRTSVTVGTTSDPFLAAGFDQKMLFVTTEDGAEGDVDVEADFLGDGTWVYCDSVHVDATHHRGVHVFPPGFSARWIRLRAGFDGTATAQMLYR